MQIIMLKTSKIVKYLLTKTIIIYIAALFTITQAAARDAELYSAPGRQLELIETIINNSQIVRDESHDVYFLHDDETNFYLKLYDYPLGVHVFSVYDNAEIQSRFYQALKKAGIDLTEEENKDYKKEYYFDFIQYVRNNKNLSFKVMPDKVSGVSTVLNTAVDKFQKEEVPYASNYTPDTGEIFLTLFDTDMFYNQDIKIIKNKYRLKQKSNRKFHAYEYVLYNNTSNDITLLDVTGDKLRKTNVLITVTTDFDKLSTISTAGGALAPFTLGISYVLKLPELVSNIKTTSELSRYTLDFPRNYVIKPNENCRILTLYERDRQVSLGFNMLINSKESTIEF